MVVLTFIASVVLTGIVASFVQVDTNTSQSDQPDYHYVPFAGDAFGA
ncbi:MAG: hypothetical protein J6D34_07040 [Atopobiaceae bacterium]|nr:hypothetical protein [Atopobiaceae bacterium]